MNVQEQLEAAIAALEAQRSILGDAVVETALAPLREKLASLQPSVLDEQRRFVTILFADISGFTQMSESLDAEEVNEVMNSLWQRLDRAILEHGGRIDKHMGDSVMAIWGADVAREDDAERAVRAGLVMLEELQVFNQGDSLPGPLHLKVGLNTGPVILSQVGTTGEYTAIGDSVNTAKRLEQAAAPDSMLITHDTFQQVRGLFRVEQLEPVQVKGKRDPLKVYRVTGLRERTFRLHTRGIEGVETPLIGRDAELKRLQDALYTVMEDGELQQVTVMGDPGIGKSRLLLEFDRWVDLLPQSIRYFNGGASQESQTRPYSLIRDLFLFRFQIQEYDSAETARAKLEKGLQEGLRWLESPQTAEVKSHFIGQLLGFDFSDSQHLKGSIGDARQIRDRGVTYLCDFFRAHAAQKPVLIQLEDIHWADDSSLEVIQQLAQSAQQSPVLIVCSARPQFFERRPLWGEGQIFHLLIQLQPLSNRDSRHLVNEILQRVEEVPAALRELVVSNAEGNPYYIEELIRMLLDDGVIVKVGDSWQVEPVRLTTVRVPPTLTGILQARLDGLPAKVRLILQRAAVIGNIFWDDGLTFLLGDDQGPEVRQIVQEALASLRGAEMISRRETSTFSGAQEYVFNQTMLREVVYESILRRERRELHARIAEWMIAHHEESAGELWGLIADHLEHAGQPEKAGVYLLRAGQQAADRFSNNEALAYFERGLLLTPQSAPEQRFELLTARERVFDLVGKREEQKQDLAEIIWLAESLNDDQKRAGAALRQAHLALVTSDYPTALQAAQQAIRLAQTAGDQKCEAEGYWLWGWTLLRVANVPEARRQLKKSLELARAANLPAVEADVLRTLGIVAADDYRYSEARTFFEQALLLHRQTGDRRGESFALNNLGLVSKNLGDNESARGYFEQALLIKRETGDRWGEASSYNNLGLLAMDVGNYMRARGEFEHSLNLYREVGDRDGEDGALINLGLVALMLGDHDEAADRFEQALQVCLEIHDRVGEGLTLADRSLLWSRLGDYQRAIEESRRALSIAQELRSPSVQGHAWQGLGDALLGLGDFQGASAAYREALVLRQALGERGPMLESLAGLARVAQHQRDLSELGSLTEDILEILSPQNLYGALQPLQVYLTCYHSLSILSDPRAPDLLETAHRLLQEQAGLIPEPELRRKFLEQIPAHREVLQLIR